MAAPLSDFKLVTTMVDPETFKVLCQHADCDGVTVERFVETILTKYVRRGLDRLAADVAKERGDDL